MRIPFAIGVCTVGALSAASLAQEAMYTNAATMPGPGSIILRPQFHYARYGSNPQTGAESSDVLVTEAGFQYGIVRDVSAIVRVMGETESQNFEDPTPNDRHDSIEEVEALFKWRFYRNDSSSLDTTRAALYGGAHVSTDGELRANPHIGAVVSRVMGRHGLNFELAFSLNTGGDQRDNYGGDGPSEAMWYNAAYVYRFYPESFTSESQSGWYATFELNGLSETSGDTEIKWSPGIMYEGRRFGFELMAQFPLYQDVDERAEMDFTVGFGFRWLF
jgi:hypothetical protein